MAVRFDAVGDKLSRSGTGTTILSSVDPPGEAQTFCCWIKRKVDTGTFATALYAAFSGAGNLEIFLETETGGDVLHFFEEPPTESDCAGPTLTIDTWFFVAVVRTNTSRALYYGTEAGGALTKVTNSDTRNIGTTANSNFVFNLGNDPFNENFNGEVSLVRYFEAALNDAEVDAEWRSTTPVKSPVRGDWRLAAAASAGTDSSGNSLTLTVAGTLTDGGTDPVVPSALPTNLMSVSRSGRRPAPFKPGNAR
jgi:hypothetical protein